MIFGLFISLFFDMWVPPPGRLINLAIEGGRGDIRYQTEIWYEYYSLPSLNWEGSDNLFKDWYSDEFIKL